MAQSEYVKIAHSTKATLTLRGDFQVKRFQPNRFIYHFTVSHITNLFFRYVVTGDSSLEGKYNQFRNK